MLFGINDQRIVERDQVGGVSRTKKEGNVVMETGSETRYGLSTAIYVTYFHVSQMIMTTGCQKEVISILG